MPLTPGLEHADPELTGALATFSAMITPAVLILACSSLLLATSGRLARTLERARFLLTEYQRLTSSSAPRTTIDATHFMLMDQLAKTTRRAKLLQLAMTFLYTALASFVLTSVFIGVDSILGESWAMALVILGLLGMSLLLTSAILLILESRVALRAVQGEMNFVREVARLSQLQDLAPELGSS
jgi:hypothetical protein